MPNKDKRPRAQRTRGGGSKQIIKAKQGATIRDVTQISGDIFQVFLGASPALANYICAREFKELVNERTRNFIGRDFIFRAIDGVITKQDFPSGYLLVRGEPGIGKTALISQLVKTRGHVHHFNIATQNIRSPRAFLENVCAQLIVRYELEYSTLPPEAVRDSGYLCQLLAEAAKKAGAAVVVLVDALDEAEDVGLAPSANRLYLPPTLPTGVFFVLTSREQIDYRIDVDRREDIYLRDNDPQNVDDVRKYIGNFLSTHADSMLDRIRAWNVSQEEFVNRITEKSDGNFMYLVHVLNDISEGRLSQATIDSVNDLPKGLRAYYQRHWRVMRDQNQERFENIYEPVLRLLATVREPISISAVEEWTKLDSARIREVIRDWRPFLNEEVSDKRVPLYRVYHASFQDFLAEEGIGLKPFHNIIAETALRKIPGFFNSE
jgi:AAA domain